MTKVILRRLASGLLQPVGEESVEAVLSFKQDAEIIGILRGARNIQQLKLFWHLAGIVSEATDRPKEAIKRAAALELGFHDVWIDPSSGLIHIDPQSIAAESMTQADFDQFFRHAVELMASWIGAEQKDLLRQFNESAADKRYEGMSLR